MIHAPSALLLTKVALSVVMLMEVMDLRCSFNDPNIFWWELWIAHTLIGGGGGGGGSGGGGGGEGGEDYQHY